MRTTIGIIALAGIVTLGGQAALAGKPSAGPPADPAIVYEARTSKGVNLMVMDRDGSNQRVLVNDGFNATWSPDGSQLAFSTGSSRPAGIYVVNRDGTGLRLVIGTSLTWETLQPVWSPAAVPGLGGGSIRLAYRDFLASNGTNELTIVNLDGTDRLQPLAPHDSIDAEANDTAWSASGSSLYFRSTTQTAPVQIILGTYDFSTGVRTDVPLQGSLAGGYLGGIAAAHQSETKIVSHARPAGGTYDIWIIDLANSGTPVNVTNTPTQGETGPSFSPDDSEIVFSGAGGIEVIGVDGANRRVLAKHSKSTSLSNPTWRSNP